MLKKDYCDRENCSASKDIRLGQAIAIHNCGCIATAIRPPKPHTDPTTYSGMPLSLAFGQRLARTMSCNSWSRAVFAVPLLLLGARPPFLPASRFFFPQRAAPPSLPASLFFLPTHAAPAADAALDARFGSHVLRQRPPEVRLSPCRFLPHSRHEACLRRPMATGVSTTTFCASLPASCAWQVNARGKWHQRIH